MYFHSSARIVETQDLDKVKSKLEEMMRKSGSSPIVVITEKVSVWLFQNSNWMNTCLSHIIKSEWLKKLPDLSTFMREKNLTLFLQDYDRDPESFKRLNPHRVFVLCSRLQILPRKMNNIDSFTTLVERLLFADKPSGKPGSLST